MKFKNILISLIATTAVAFASPLTAHAENEETAPVSMLLIHLNDDKVDQYILSQTPEVTFEGTDLVVNSNDAFTNYDRSNVSHFEIKKVQIASVEQTPADELAKGFTLKYVDNATLEVYANGLSQVEIYNASGMKVASAKADQGKATISVADLTPGIYVVTTNCHQAVKIVKH